jgi:hypothetical protein
MRYGLGPLALTTAVLVLGCKPSPGSGGTSSSAPNEPSAKAAAAVAIDAFCQQAFGATAEQALKGCSEEERAATAARNTLEFAREPLKECRRLSVAVAAERMTLDSAAAAKCLSSTTATKRVDGTWGDLAVPDLDESPACDAVFAGKQAEGQPCGSTLECKEPLSCLGATDETKADGTCKAVPAHAGDPCDSVFLRVRARRLAVRAGARRLPPPTSAALARTTPTTAGRASSA